MPKPIRACLLAFLVTAPAFAVEACTIKPVTIDAPEYYAALGLSGGIYAVHVPAGMRFTAWMELYHKGALQNQSSYVQLNAVGDRPADGRLCWIHLDPDRIAGSETTKGTWQFCMDGGIIGKAPQDDPLKAMHIVQSQSEVLAGGVTLGTGLARIIHVMAGRERETDSFDPFRSMPPDDLLKHEADLKQNDFYLVIKARLDEADVADLTTLGRSGSLDANSPLLRGEPLIFGAP